MCRVIIEAGIDLKIRIDRLYGLDQFSGMVHTADRILDSHEIRVPFPQSEHRLRGDRIARPLREIVEIDRSLDLVEQFVIIGKQFTVREPEIIRAYDHNSVRSVFQHVIGKWHDPLIHHI